MIRPLETTYGGIRYRSRTEARWAVFFDAAGIRAHYEFEGFLVRSGGYLPDFYLPDQHLFVEVKGTDPTDAEIAKCDELARTTEHDFVLAVGPPRPEFSLLWFDREGRRDGLYVLARDRIITCGFWLVGEDDAHNIGPNVSGTWPRGPMFSDGIDAAYRIAAACRFSQNSRAYRAEAQPYPPERREAA